MTCHSHEFPNCTVISGDPLMHRFEKRQNRYEPTTQTNNAARANEEMAVVETGMSKRTAF